MKISHVWCGTTWTRRSLRSGHFSEQQAAILMQQIIRRGPESGELYLIHFAVIYIVYKYIYTIDPILIE